MVTALVALLVTLTLLGPGEPARAADSIYGRVLRAYQLHGSVPVCEFTSRQLQDALNGMDTYGAQYFSDFATAIQSALSQRASGACGAGAAEALGRLSRLAPAPPHLRPPPASVVTRSTSASPPLILVLLALGAAALIILVPAAGLWRWGRWEPTWLQVWRHAWGEAAHRGGALRADFGDWLRGHG